MSPARLLIPTALAFCTLTLPDAALAQGQKPGPRPAVGSVKAWVRLPEFCGRRPDGSPFEQAQKGGDIVAIAGSSVRVVVQTERPVKKAVLELWGPEGSNEEGKAAREVLKKSLAMRLQDGGLQAEAIFPLSTAESAYRIIVTDADGRSNEKPPRHTLRVIPEPAPGVVLLAETWPPLVGVAPAGQDKGLKLDDLPTATTHQLRIAFRATHPYGLGGARLLYRVLAKADDGLKPPDWDVLPLEEVTASERTGAFDPDRGCFKNSTDRDRVAFHAVPSADAAAPGRTIGGGRFDVPVRTLFGLKKGSKLKLRGGGRIEFCIEVFAGKTADAGRPAGRSTIRVKTIVTPLEFSRRLQALRNERIEAGNLQLARDLFKAKRPPQVAPRPVPDEAAGKAAARGLEWLAAKQNADGSWSDTRYTSNTAITAYAVLAFLSQGHLPNEGKYGPHLAKAALFLATSARSDGCLVGTRGGNMYCHALATLALAELHAQTGEEKLRPVLDAAVDLIVRCQDVKGGWRYEPRPSAGDISITTMQLLALREAKRAGVKVPDATFEKGRAFVLSCYQPRLKGFAYVPHGGAVGFSRNASGTCALLLTGAADAKDYPKVIESLRDGLKERQWFWYGNYYVGLIMSHLGGKEAEDWQGRLTKQLLPLQQADGSWAFRDNSSLGPVYQTSIAVVLLSAPAHNLPLLRR